MNVKDVLTQEEALFGKEITVDGFLVEKAPERHLYLAPDYESKDDISNSIRVELPISRQRLDERLPCWLGTKYAHVDPATLTGILQPSHDGVFPVVITSLTAFTAQQREEVINILAEG